MNLREKQKIKRHAAILNSAAKIIRRQGYRKTTMENIAAEAEVGVATVYNYFGTKENIFRAIFDPELQRIIDEAEKVLSNPPEDPTEAIMLLLRCYMSLGYNWSDKNILQVISVPFSGEYDTTFTDVIDGAENTVVSQIARLIGIFQEQGKIPGHFDNGEVASIIFFILNEEYLRCVLNEDAVPEGSFEKIERLTSTLFSLWSPAEDGPGP